MAHSGRHALQYSAAVRPCSLLLAGVTAFALAAAASAQPAPSTGAPIALDVALDRTAVYIDFFIERFGNVVSEERYQQEAVPSVRPVQLG